MQNDPHRRTVSTLIRWTDDEWLEIARNLCAKQGTESLRALSSQKIRAKDVFLAQEVLPEDRHRKLVSIAQGFAGIRARLAALTQMLPDGEQAAACTKKEEVGLERGTAPGTKAGDSPTLEQGVKASDRISESDGLAAEQSIERNLICEKQESRLVRQAFSGADRRHGYAPSLMETTQPFIAMICEEFAKAVVKVISAHGIKGTPPAAFGQARSHVAASRKEALHVPNAEQTQLDLSANKTDQGPPFADEADIERVDVDFASQEEGEEGDALHVQPLFDPKLPPSADTDFKPKIGLVGKPGSDFEGLRQRYPQLHLTIVQADALSDIRRFGHCQRIIALREEISPGTDALLSRLLRHRYIRLDGGINEVKAQIDAWLASPASIAAGLRRRMPLSGIERNAASGKKRQNRYPKRMSDAA